MLSRTDMNIFTSKPSQLLRLPRNVVGGGGGASRIYTRLYKTGCWSRRSYFKATPFSRSIQNSTHCYILFYKHVVEKGKEITTITFSNSRFKVTFTTLFSSSAGHCSVVFNGLDVFLLPVV